MARTIDDLPEIDLRSAPYLASPHEVYAALRSRSPLARSHLGVHVLDHASCERAFLDPVFLHGGSAMVDRAGASGMSEGLGRTLTGTEGSEHAALRRAVQPWFTPRNIERLRLDTEALVRQRFDTVAGAATCEFVHEIARDIPGVVFSWMIGTPASDGPRLTRLSEVLLRVFLGDPEDGPAILEAAMELFGYVGELLQDRRARPGDDLISCLVGAVDGVEVTEQDVFSLVAEMLTASTDNTFNAASIVMLVLAERPAAWDMLRRDRALVANAVDECLRWEPRVRLMPTVTAEEVVLHGVAIPARTLVQLDLASAHRDPDAFPEPDTFDLRREFTHRQLNFGVGRHHCLGAALARMELQAVLGEALERWAAISLDGIPDAELATAGAVHRLPLAVAPS